MSCEICEKRGERLYRSARGIMMKVKGSPRHYLEVVRKEIAEADLVFGVWNEPDKTGLFSYVVIGDEYVDPRTGFDLPAPTIAAIPCRNQLDAIAYRVLLGADAEAPQGRVWQLHRGHEVRVNTLLTIEGSFTAPITCH